MKRNISKKDLAFTVFFAIVIAIIFIGVMVLQNLNNEKTTEEVTHLQNFENRKTKADVVNLQNLGKPIENIINFNSRKAVALTFDDLPFAGPETPIKTMVSETEKLLSGLKSHNVPAIGFVNETKLYHLGEIDERIAILNMWLDAGFDLGNHTFSHPSLAIIPLAQYEANVIRGETVTKLLLADHGKKMEYFRHPFLETGRTLKIRKEFEKFLNQHGYTVAPVTIEAADYMFNLLYVDAKNNNDTAKMAKIKEAYLKYTNQKFEEAEKMSEQLFAYQIRQILLLHSNEINADYIGDLIDLISARGYTFITLKEALQDKVYPLPNNYAAVGDTWMFQWYFMRNGEFTRHLVVPAEIMNEFNEAVKNPNAGKEIYNTNLLQDNGD